MVDPKIEKSDFLINISFQVSGNMSGVLNEPVEPENMNSEVTEGAENSTDSYFAASIGLDTLWYGNEKVKFGFYCSFKLPLSTDFDKISASMGGTAELDILNSAVNITFKFGGESRMDGTDAGYETSAAAAYMFSNATFGVTAGVGMSTVNDTTVSASVGLKGVIF